MKMDLVILAGGMGSRFGGDKQTSVVDNNGNFLVDYSIFDALNVGFEKIVVITKKECLEVFENSLSKRVPKGKIEYVVQSDDILKIKKIDRQKPLGTAHAILCAEKHINDNFCVINADDFYGRKSFALAYDLLKTLDKDALDFGLIGYKLENTLSEYGAVKRGICRTENDYILNIVESKIEQDEKGIHISPLNKDDQIEYEPNMLVSMNMFCLTPKLFECLQKEFENFCSNIENLKDKEFLLPQVLNNLVKNKQASIKVLPTQEKWFGMTYRADLPLVEQSLDQLVKQHIYPQNLWQNAEQFK